ncbi:hypothetical protein BDZ89DRAFT_1101048 [Hymenopellis radicata]|nr:hypothetical protein BDZ89DRAFT_1101048 [Hymenopellis radicata]
MSTISSGPEAQDSLFSDNSPKNTPSELSRATLRLDFPPSYIVVGVYRLFTDKALYQPVWEKCRHGTQRGATIAVVWGFLTFKIQRKFIEFFMSNSPRVTGLSDDTILGYQVPFSLYTYAAFVFVATQATFILKFFLSRNMRVARDRAWDQTPYVEEWDNPPVVKKSWTERLFGSWFAAFVVKRSKLPLILLTPFSFIPFFGIIISAWFKGLGTAHILHRRYFESKKMTPEQIDIFMEERKWDYRTFGFAAAILEGIPILGLVFTVSNRVGAAMWAHDLEKRQHFYATKKKL